jgi:FMN phosphatase YigB (HAD superfamily)
MECLYKIVVFDLDETLGYFVELGIFWEALKEYCRINKYDLVFDQELFNKVLDLYPEFQRPNIVKILNYLKDKKVKNHCNQIMIYTNNQAPKIWSEYIKKYYESKISFPLFDKIIAAFKVNGQIIEMCRTTTNKNFKDLVRCTKIPENAKVCFIDDTYYPDMARNNIYYIHIKPYIHDLPFETMIDRFLQNDISNQQLLGIEFKEQMIPIMQLYNYEQTNKSISEIKIDKILSKKVLEHLRKFFKDPTPCAITRKNTKGPKRKTLKKF